MIDKTYVIDFLDAVGIQTICIVIVTIRKVNPTKRRPIKLVMNSEEDKNKIVDKSEG